MSEHNQGSSVEGAEAETAQLAELQLKSPGALPPPPDPASDLGIIPPRPKDEGPTLESALESSGIDIFDLSATTALKLMCASLDNLVHITGDVPPTPPVRPSKAPLPSSVQTPGDRTPDSPSKSGRSHRPRPSSLVVTPDDLEPVKRQRTPVGSPEAAEEEPVPHVDVQPDPSTLQHGAIIRKFYSKKPPPVSLNDYLLRLHRYCPMSTAVYLATSLYIQRLAVADRVLSVTARNVHRLVLSGLRVAMKALEDLNYPHSRFATVGGVSEPELARLEISFCFVSNFNLKVDEETLLAQAKALKDSATAQQFPTFEPKMPPMKDKRRAVTT